MQLECHVNIWKDLWVDMMLIFNVYIYIVRDSFMYDHVVEYILKPVHSLSPMYFVKLDHQSNLSLQSVERALK
jgi:hypothetical protein